MSGGAPLDYKHVVLGGLLRWTRYAGQLNTPTVIRQSASRKPHAFNWSAWVRSAFLLFAASAEAADQRVETAQREFQPFRIRQFTYDSNSVLRPLSVDHPSRVSRLFYGEQITNVVFRNDSISVESKDEGGAPDRSSPLYRLQRWGTEHGLPANKVRALLPTRDGYLWIGTVGGVARFDGVRFTVFEEMNIPEMRSEGSNARALIEDEGGRVWIGTERGLLCWEGDSFVRFSGQETVRGRVVNWLSPRRNGGFWIATDSGVGYWDGGQIRWVDGRQIPLAAQSVRTVLDSSAGLLWLGCDTGLYEISVANGGTNRFYEAFDGRQRGLSPATALHRDRHQRLWIGGILGLWRWDPSASAPVQVRHRDGDPQARPKWSKFAEDAGGALWVTRGPERGLFRFVGESLEPVSILDSSESLNDTLCVATDVEDVIWVGSRDGLFRLRRQPLTSFALIANRGINALRTMAEGPDGSLLFGDETVLARWAGRDITQLVMQPSADAKESKPVFCATADGVWAGGQTPGVVPLFSVSSKFKFPVPAAPRFVDIGVVETMLNARAGGLWMASERGLFRTQDYQRLDRTIPFPSMMIRALAEDSNAHLWIGTAKAGLYQLTSAGLMEACVEQSLKQAGILSLHVSEDDALWIGTSSGLAHFRSGRLTVFPEESGLPQTAIFGVIEDDQSQLWLNHSQGISRVAWEELVSWLNNAQLLPAVAHYGVSDGLLSIDSERASPSVLKGKDGRLWFIKHSELAVVDPAEVPLRIPPPQVRIEKVTVDGSTFSPRESLTLSPGVGRAVEVSFTTTTLHSPEKALLQYRLSPLEQAWRDAGSVRRAVYSDLKPGRYKFHARARNHEGRWSEREAVLEIELPALWWRTSLFSGICGTAIVGALVALMAWRLRRQRLRLNDEQIESLEVERNRIARDMHDHLGAHLAGVALASGQGEDAQDRARQTLRELNELIWSVHPANDNFPSLVDFVSNFAERLLSSAGVKLELDLPAEIPAIPLAGRFRQEVAAMFKEALRNVVQHACARVVTIQMAVERNHLRLVIRDDGRGFSLDGPRGNGLQNLELRASGLGGICRIVSLPGSGTSVEIFVPLPR